MQKKYVSIMLMVTVFMLSIVGCGGGTTSDEGSTSNNEQLNVDKSADEGEIEDNEVDKETLITVEELPYEITMLEPDSSGARYMEATFTNNSNYTVIGYSLTVLLKEENEKTYLSIYDTVKSGETSSKFETFAPESGEEDDMEVLEYELTIQDEEGMKYFVDYDVKLDKYEVFEALDEGPEEVLVKVEELPYEITMLEPDSSGVRYMEATFTNNSNYIVTGYSLTVLLKDKNEKTYLSIYDTVMPGETSSKFETFAPESGGEDDMEMLEYELTIHGEDGTEYFVDYDVKLDKYEVVEAIDD